MFHKVVWQQMEGVMGFLIKLWCKFSEEYCSEKKSLEHRLLRSDTIVAVSLWPRFLAYSVHSQSGVVDSESTRK